MRTDEDRVQPLQPLTLKLKRSASGIQRLATTTLTPPLHIKPSSTSAFPTTSALKSTAGTSNNCSPSVCFFLLHIFGQFWDPMNG